MNILTLISMALGFLFLAMGAIPKKMFHRTMLYATESVEATILDIEERPATLPIKGTKRFYPTYGFYAEGNVQQFQSKISLFPCPFSKGDKVELNYNPDKLSQFYIAEDLKAVNQASYRYFLIGILCLLASVITIYL